MRNLEDFQKEVGASDPVCVRGGGTQWALGGLPNLGCREVLAPGGLVAFQPAEMTVTVGAGMRLTDLTTVLSEQGQEVALEGGEGATVGGLLAVGRSSMRWCRIGTARDTLLQADCVGADGEIFRAGGPTVKNVTGYDLCRLLVGSLGTLGLFGRVTLRTRPIPETTVWIGGCTDYSLVVQKCYRPATLLWDGKRVAIRLEGYYEDVEEEAAVLKSEFGVERLGEVPQLPLHRSRWNGSLPLGGFLEVFSGIVYSAIAGVPPGPPSAVLDLANRLKKGFDPAARLNPGRDPYQFL